MKTFIEFVEQKNLKRKYVSVIYDQPSQKKLRDWCIKNGFDLTKSYDEKDQNEKDFEFHTTIFYTTNEVSIKNETINLTPIEVTIDDIKFLGENEDIPVLTLSNSSDIMKLRKHFEGLGLKDQWPTYLPHISVSYSKEHVDITKIKIPTFKPKFDRIVIQDIEE
jgi:hypothetical protein